VTRWALLATLLTGLLASLVLHGLLARSPAGREVGPAALAGTTLPGPLVEIGAGTIRSSPGTAGTVGIALVDTGSVTAWRDALAVLERHRGEATWFVTGRTLLDHAGAVEDARVAGGEVGVTGFSGRDLGGLPAWRLRVELASAQAALAARTGTTTPLLLVPSSATPDTVDRAAVDAARTAAAQGYSLVVGAPPEAVAPGEVAVVALDRDGARRLDALLARLAAAGVRPARVSEAAGLDPATVNTPVGAWARLTALAVTATVRSADALARAVDLLFVPLAVLMSCRAVVAVILALRHARRRPLSR
jgi:peptidoglycan/xylan/chitin deacetylase (PgdA/CDA1 family)